MTESFFLMLLQASVVLLCIRCSFIRPGLTLVQLVKKISSYLFALGKFWTGISGSESHLATDWANLACCGLGWVGWVEQKVYYTDCPRPMHVKNFQKKCSLQFKFVYPKKLLIFSKFGFRTNISCFGRF